MPAPLYPLEQSISTLNIFRKGDTLKPFCKKFSIQTSNRGELRFIFGRAAVSVKPTLAGYRILFSEGSSIAYKHVLSLYITSKKNSSKKKVIKFLTTLVAHTTNLQKPLSLSNNILHLCTNFSHKFGIALANMFQENNLGITPEQFSILVALLYIDGSSQKDLALQLNRDKTTITRVLAAMKTRGFIKQVTHPVDKRTRLVYITPKGRAVQKKAVELSSIMYAQVMGGVNMQMQHTGIQLLQQMLVNLTQ